MELNFDSLIKFHIVEDAEKEVLSSNNLPVLTDFIKTFQEISAVDQFIKESPSYPGSTDKIRREELISAIGATLAIEGTNINEEEIQESFRKADVSEKLKCKEQEAENSRKVYQFIIELVRNNKDSFEFSEKIIKQIHKYFTDGMNYLSNTPGVYRNFPTTFGYPRREGLCKTQSEIEQAMSNLIKWLNTPAKGILANNIIIKAIMAHYYLAEIHPFGDGNGRTARALEALVLYVYGINNYCFWSLANFWNSERDQYIVQLGNVRSTSSPIDFLIWGMKGYLTEIKRIKSKVLKKVKQLMLMDYAKYLLANKKEEEVKINQRIIDVLHLLVRRGKTPYDKFYNLPEVSALFKTKSSTTKLRDFKKLQELRLVNLIKENEIVFIEPNFQILELVTYNV